MSALVCSHQLLEEDQTHERQPISTRLIEAVHNDPKKRREEKTACRFLVRYQARFVNLSDALVSLASHTLTLRLADLGGVFLHATRC
jgi:hypothetical protein